MNSKPAPTEQDAVPAPPERDGVPIEQLRAAHRVLAEFHYTPPRVERGYANQTLYVNVGDNTVASKPVDDKMKRLTSCSTIARSRFSALVTLSPRYING